MSIWRRRPDPPTPAILRPLAIFAVPGARVRLEAPAGSWTALTDARGIAALPAVPDGVTMPTANLFVESVGQPNVGAPGYAWYGRVIAMPPDAAPHHLYVIRAQHVLQEPFEVQLPHVLQSLRPWPAERGRLTIDGHFFRDEAGAHWQWRGCTDFLLFHRYLQGEDIQPVLDERIAMGFNVLRVLGMVAWDRLGFAFYPQRIPDYYTKLRAFADLLATNGLRMEFVVFADAQIIMPHEAEQEAHLEKVLKALT